MKLRAIAAFSLGGLLCLVAVPLSAAPNSGGISGVVVDSRGTPQMGATVLVSSERLLDSLSWTVLTNDRGRFATSTLPAGMYSVRVTLAGFLPTMEQHIQVNDQHTTLLEIVLGSVFSSLERLRRVPDQQIAADDWTWVLRSSAATRSVLRWQDSQIVLNGQQAADIGQKQGVHALLDLTSGADRPGSIGNPEDSPATALVYDVGVGSRAHFLVAGQFNYEDASQAGGLAAEWLPSGEIGSGPVTSFVIRQSRLGPDGPVFRGLRVSHDDGLSIGDRVFVRYGAEYIAAGFNSGTTSALRPRGEVALQLGRSWQASVMVASRPWQDSTEFQSALESAIDSLDAFPTLMVRDGHPVLEDGWHEEITLKYSLNGKASLSAAAFHDRSNHTAVIGKGGFPNPDFLQDYFSNAFAYDGGTSTSTGARVAYRQKLADGIDAAVVYAYAGALGLDGDQAASTLRSQLATRYHQSLGGRVSTRVPHVGTKFTAGYKWFSGPAVSHLDPYGESLYRLDPYLSMELRQPLPSLLQCHMEVLAEVGNLLAQGYVPISTNDGQVVLVSSPRYFRGGLSIQF